MKDNGKLQRLVIVFQILMAIGFLGFWLSFFLQDPCRVNGPKLPDCLASQNIATCIEPILSCERYLAFESAFPLPDLGYLAPLLVISAWQLAQKRRSGYLTSVMAGSALIFLGLLDISFNVQNARYSIALAETITNVFINAVCLIWGSLLIAFGWRNLAS